MLLVGEDSSAVLLLTSPLVARGRVNKICKEWVEWDKNSEVIVKYFGDIKETSMTISHLAPCRWSVQTIKSAASSRSVCGFLSISLRWETFSSSLSCRRVSCRSKRSAKENRKEIETGSCLASLWRESALGLVFALSSQLSGRLFNLLGTKVRACYVLERAMKPKTTSMEVDSDFQVLKQ